MNRDDATNFDDVGSPVTVASKVIETTFPFTERFFAILNIVIDGGSVQLNIVHHNDFLVIFVYCAATQ